MKKRSHVGRGVLAGAVLAASGGALAYLAVAPAQAAGTPPQITTVTSHNGGSTVTLGHPKPAATAHISAQAVAYDSASNGDEAVAVVTGTGQAHVYLIAGANEPNEYHIATAPTVFGTLVKGDVYLVAGNGTLGQIAFPGAPTVTTGGSTSPYAVKNPVAPISLGFDHSGNLLINGYHTVTSVYTSGIQMVSKATCSTSCPYQHATLKAGYLYTLAGEGMPGLQRVPAVHLSFGVAGWGLAVDSHGNFLDSANGEVLYVNVSTSPVTAYGKTLAARSATNVAGTVTTGKGSNTCGGGTVSHPATSSTSPNFVFAHPYVDANGNLYVNDNRSNTGAGCVWVVPAATGSLDGIPSATAGTMYSLSGSTSTPAFTNGATANTANFANTSAVVTDPAGNVVITLSGVHPAVRVIAESKGKFYGQTMTKGHAYLIAGGPTATRTTTPGNATGFEFAGVAVTTTPPAHGITSLANGAAGNVLLANGATATTGSLYQITQGPTTPVGPKTTHTTLSVNPASPGYHGTTITLTASLTPTNAVGTVTFYNGATSLGKVAVSGGIARLHTTTLPNGTLTLQAKFVATTVTAFTNSTSATVPYKVETKPLTTVTGVVQPITVTVKAGHLTLSCTHYVTTEAAAIKVCQLVTLPQVTISGVTQHTSKTMNTVFVYTARGTATSGWALSAVMVPTSPTLNTNASCTGVQGFCNSTAGTHAATVAHGQIPATDLSLRGYACTPAATNANPAPSATPGGPLKTSRPLCSAVAGKSGGVFTLGQGTFTLTIPSTIYHGHYYGTVEYSLVST
jgi:hypothetical protein